MNPRRAEVDRRAEAFDTVDAATNSLARLDDGYIETSRAQGRGGAKARKARAYDDYPLAARSRCAVGAAGDQRARRSGR